MTVLLDHDISGHQALCTGTVYSTGWAEYHLVRFITLIEAGLTKDALDRDIWRYCQSHSFLFLRPTVIRMILTLWNRHSAMSTEKMPCQWSRQRSTALD